MATIEVKVDGLKELQDDLLQLPVKIGERTLQRALTSAALPIVREAQDKIPIAHQSYKLYGGDSADPGWLRQQIVRKKVKNSNNSAEVVVTIKQQKESYFWRFIEFGTSKLPAHPFLRPAFESKQKEALDRFIDKLTDGIAKAVEKLNYKP
jgi:HK97 gp10 family phage protein